MDAQVSAGPGIDTQRLEEEMDAFHKALGGKGRVSAEVLAAQFCLNSGEAQEVINFASEDPPWARDLANPDNLLDLQREQAVFEEAYVSLLEQTFVPGDQLHAEKQLLEGLAGKVELAVHRGLQDPEGQHLEILGALHDLRGATIRLGHPQLFEEAALLAIRRPESHQKEIIQLASPALTPSGLIRLASAATPGSMKWMTAKDTDRLLDFALDLDAEDALYPLTVRTLLDANQALGRSAYKVEWAIWDMADGYEAPPRGLKSVPLPLPPDQRLEVTSASNSLLAESSLAELQTHRRAADAAIVIARLNGGPRQDAARWSRAVGEAAEWSPLAWCRCCEALNNHQFDHPVPGGPTAISQTPDPNSHNLWLITPKPPTETMAFQNALQGFLSGIRTHGSMDGRDADDIQVEGVLSLVDGVELPDHAVRDVFQQLGTAGLAESLLEPSAASQELVSDGFLHRKSRAIEGALVGGLLQKDDPHHGLSRNHDSLDTWHRGLRALLNLAGTSGSPVPAEGAAHVIHLAAQHNIEFHISQVGRPPED